MLGGSEKIRTPAMFVCTKWEDYEVVTVRRVAEWARQHPGGVFLDIGAAFGIYAQLVLTAAPNTSVIAFESNLSSIKLLELVCRPSRREALRTVHGYVGEWHESGLNLEEAAVRTSALLAATPVPRRREPSYICFDSRVEHADIPVHSVDGLIDHRVLGGRPVLLKCDIEGAELLALRGAKRLLAEQRPTLVVSVHPKWMPLYGQSAEALVLYLVELGYDITVLEKDWEEHWWCTPTQAAAASA